MEEYRRIAMSGGPTPGLKFLAAFGQLTTLEGAEPDGVAIMEFPTVEAAKAWYGRPHYLEAVTHRLKAATFQTFIVEGLAPTSA